MSNNMKRICSRMCQESAHAGVCIELHNKTVEELGACSERLKDSERKLNAVIEKLKEMERFIQQEESEAMELFSQAASMRAQGESKRRKAAETLSTLRPLWFLATGEEENARHE